MRISSHSTASWPSASTRAATSSRVTATLICKLASERNRIVARAVLDPRPVVGRDQRPQRRAVVMRGNGGETAPFDDTDDGALGLDAPARLGVVDVRDELFLARTNLERECALRGFRQHHVPVEPQSDLVREPEPVETAGSEHDRIETALTALAQ